MERPEDILGFLPDGAGEFDSTKIDKKPIQYVRGDRFDAVDFEQWRDPQKMIKFMNNMQHVPIEAIDDRIVNESYAAAVWLFRKYAINGDAKGTATMEKWLNWAKPILSRPPQPTAAEQSPGSSAFLAREPKTGEE